MLIYSPLLEIDREQLQRIDNEIVPDVQASVLLTESLSNFWDLDQPQHRWGLDAAFRNFRRDFSKAVTPPGRWEGELFRRLYGFVEPHPSGMLVTVRLGFENWSWMSFGTFDHVLDMSFCWHICELDTYPQLDTAELDTPLPVMNQERVLLLTDIFSCNLSLTAEILGEEDSDEDEELPALPEFDSALM